jgi:hypothetical protein
MAKKTDSGNGQLVPYLSDALDSGIDISTREKALEYLSILSDPDAFASYNFLIEYFDAKDYYELYIHLQELRKDLIVDK